MAVVFILSLTLQHTPDNIAMSERFRNALVEFCKEQGLNTDAWWNSGTGMLDEASEALVSHSGNVLMIGTLKSFKSIRDRYGADSVKGLYIECEDGARLQRALDREKGESSPKYKEMCRRFLADEEDYSEEKIVDAGIDRIVNNDELESCVNEIEEYLRTLL